MKPRGVPLSVVEAFDRARRYAARPPERPQPAPEPARELGGWWLQQREMEIEPPHGPNGYARLQAMPFEVVVELLRQRPVYAQDLHLPPAPELPKPEPLSVHEQMRPISRRRHASAPEPMEAVEVGVTRSGEWRVGGRVLPHLQPDESRWSAFE